MATKKNNSDNAKNTYTDSRGVTRYSGSNNRVDGTTGQMSSTQYNAQRNNPKSVNTLTSSGGRNAAVDSTASSTGNTDTYGNRETAYIFKDPTTGKSQTIFSNVTRYDQVPEYKANPNLQLVNATTYGVAGSGSGRPVTYGSQGYSSNSSASGGFYGEAMRRLNNNYNTFGGTEGFKNTLDLNNSAYEAYMKQGYLPAYAQDQAGQNINWGGIVGDDYRGGGYYDAPSYSPGSYTSPYADYISSVLGKILNREKFSYDYNTDPLYKQYADIYTREGERATQNAIADASAMTGGLPSSYAVTAGTQAGNYYSEKLGDKIPELQQHAYQMYLDEIGLNRDDLSMLSGLENSDYGRWSDAEDRNYNAFLSEYNAYRDSVADNQWQQEYNYGLERDALDDSRYDYKMSGSEREEAYNRVSYLLENLVMPSAEQLSAAGVSEEEARALIASYKAASVKKSSGSGSGSSKTAKTLPDDIYEQMYNSNDPYLTLFNIGSAADLSNTQLDNFYKNYVNVQEPKLKAQETKSKSESKTYNTTNGQTEGRIYLKGYGTVGPGELDTLISNGKVKIYEDGSSYYYEYKG